MKARGVEHEFFEHNVEFSLGAKCSASQLFVAYRRYCKQEGLSALPRRPFLRAAKSYANGRAAYTAVRIGEEVSRGFKGMGLEGVAAEVIRCPTCNRPC